LYRKAIPDGAFHGLHFPILPAAGIANNFVAGVTSIPGLSGPFNSKGYWDNVCAGYQGQVLNLLDALRGNPLTAPYFTALDYGPVQTNGGGHHAVVLYDSGTDFKTTGDMLDPWTNQTAEVSTFAEWTRVLKGHFVAGPDQQAYPGQYPIN